MLQRNDLIKKRKIKRAHALHTYLSNFKLASCIAFQSNPVVWLKSHANQSSIQSKKKIEAHSFSANREKFVECAFLKR